MGGYVNIAVRFRDGRTFCQERATNNMPAWFRSPSVITGEDGPMLSYLGMVAGNDFDAGEVGRPQPIQESEYGLVVIDLKSKIVLDANRYCHVEVDHSRMTLLRFNWGTPDYPTDGEGDVHPEMASVLKRLGIPMTFSEGLLKDLSQLGHDFALEARAQWALSRVLEPLDAYRAAEHFDRALHAASVAGKVGRAQSAYFDNEPDLAYAAANSKHQIMPGIGPYA